MKTGIWAKFYKTESEKPYFKALLAKVDAAYLQDEVFPPREDLFTAFDLCPFEQTKVVVLGQDPYHKAGQAMGLAFSVNSSVKIPPSLRNIYKELESDLGITPAKHGDLTAWANRGVLLLNATLTVEESNPQSHAKLGWGAFTDAVITKLSKDKQNLVFWLWGNFAKSKKRLINTEKHLVIESAHPSPLSARRGFFGSRPFTQTNQFLKAKGLAEIDFGN